MSNSLEKLKQKTTVVADTGNFQLISEFQPKDATTNPSLIYQASQDKKLEYIVDKAVEYSLERSKDEKERIRYAMDRVAVMIGYEILKIIPGRVSTEIDARLSFDVTGTVERAREIIRMYEEDMGVKRDRILIKIASTWEGIRAGEILEKEGIHCNLTLLFSLVQAVACAESKITLISPFVGRILDWHKAKGNVFTEDPGVVSVRDIFHYFKRFDYNTIIMGASFRNVDEIANLCGVDYLTISPTLLKSLMENKDLDMSQKLDPEVSKKMDIQKIDVSEKNFRWLLNQDQMATEKLSEGIRLFTNDLIKLENVLTEKIRIKSSSK